MDKEKQQQQFPLVKKTVSRDNSGKKQCRNFNKIWYEIKKKAIGLMKKKHDNLQIKSGKKERGKMNK